MDKGKERRFTAHSILLLPSVPSFSSANQKVRTSSCPALSERHLSLSAPQQFEECTSREPQCFGFYKLSTDLPGTLHLLYPPSGESLHGHTSAAQAVGRGSRNLKELHIESQVAARSRRRNGSGGLGTAVALSREPAPSNGTEHLFVFRGPSGKRQSVAHI